MKLYYPICTECGNIMEEVMEIYKIITEKVCHAICHMNYKIVVHQAVMKGDDGFTFTLNDDTEVFVDFWSTKYIIYINGKKLLSEEWNTSMTVDGIADNIIDGLRYNKVD